MNNRVALYSRSAMLACVLMTILISSAFYGLVSVRATQESVRTVDERTKKAIIDSITVTLNNEYIFPDVARKIEKLLRDSLKEGTYQRIKNLPEFTQKLTADVRSVNGDRHLSVIPLDPRQGGRDTLSPDERRKREVEGGRRENYGFNKVEILPGNIGYIDLRRFADVGVGEAAMTASAAMNFVAFTDALIIDLRQNGGGQPSMIQLLSSYLFEKSVHLNSFYIRRTNSTKQCWTQESVAGPKIVGAPVYVLTSSGTFSAAEEFSYNLKNLKRAVIVGETTGGGAHDNEFREFSGFGIVMSLPFARAINPITGTNWEGTGVEPDIKVPANKALLEARIHATRLLLAGEKDEGRKQRRDWDLKGLLVEKDPVTLSEEALEIYVGVYGPRKITLDQGILVYQRGNGPKYRLIPMGNDTFLISELDYFRVRFKRDSSNRIGEIVGLYWNGPADSHKRDEN